MGVRLPPFQVLLDEHGDDVYRLLVALVGPDDADDCFQETFLSALRAYGELRHADNLRGWLLTIAHRKALDSHRARARRPVPVAQVVEVAGDGRPRERSPLWDDVRALPPKQRGAVALRFVADLAYADIARTLGCSPEAARRSVHEGLVKLRKDWTK